MTEHFAPSDARRGTKMPKQQLLKRAAPPAGFIACRQSRPVFEQSEAGRRAAERAVT